ncbi:hypothetical protein G7Y89_g10266 [Cudoniella acicularis]|uniref:Nucleoside phosphorylase domain-containing protein n=1 Tax=Cudoniella acicularis TaxID=354080 RepID=A0A8H4W1T3_9HELO|nr:hypothetical protein G7Y89_g10266 [Cudoniella acicularis]
MSKRELDLENNRAAASGAEKERKIGCDDFQPPTVNAPERMLLNDDYTVGWICAISTEYVAAQAFLDERHERPYDVSLNDNNIYTLGTVGKHNVVIAVLPDGEYGITSAASVGRDMLHSFPNVRIGLMVGIGGGAPSRNHDIRLGDLVVSAPREGNSGVFQYDFGKRIQDQSFQPTGLLNQPPILLRAAVNGLKAQYEAEGHRLNEAINSILEKKPRLTKKYKQPDLSSDRLYQSRVTHPLNNEASCAAVCGDDLSILIVRLARTKGEDNPAIHYGLIASANQLMKDALVRDTLAAEKDILCFEMEAAGLINHFPCLVIRGICDYSDTHKNKEWQGYAAMAAAAYANDLLCQIPPNKVKAEKKISELFSSVLDTVSRTEANIEKVRSRLEKEEDLETLNWLTPFDYGSQQSDNLRRRQPGTGQWLLDSEEYQAWLKTSQQTLFCPGIPGAGKTILTSIVVDNLSNRFRNNPTIGIAYLYCNFQRQHEQNIEDLLASLLKQLTQGRSHLPDSVKSLHDKHKGMRTRLLFDEISRALHSVATIYSRVFIVLDALDECQASDSCRSRFLSEIFNLQAKTRVNLFATSRPIPGIEREFKGCLLREILASDKDVSRYLDGHISQLPGFVLSSLELQEEIKIKISTAVKGMHLYLDSLEDKTTPKAIKRTLQQLHNQARGPGEDQKLEALAQAYDHAMERIKCQKPGLRDLAKRVLSWISCAKRPVTTWELQHALAVEVGEPEPDEDNLSQIDDIVSVCAGLVTVDKESHIIRLVHHTTYKYLRTHMFCLDQQRDPAIVDSQQNDIARVNIENYITAICITYLSFDRFGTGSCPTDNEFQARLRLNKFYDYAARNWGYHALAASKEMQQSILDFLSSGAKVSASTQPIMKSRMYVDYNSMTSRQMTAVHVAAYFGLGKGISALIETGYYADIKDSFGRTPLSWAAESGQKVVAKLLIAVNGVDPNAIDQKGLTPLIWAIMMRHKAIVKLLLAYDRVNPNFESEGRTPLIWAMTLKHKTIVKLLLAHERVDPNFENSEGRTPLVLAIAMKHKTIVKLLLAYERVDPNFRSGGQTPLIWAMAMKHKRIVKILLANERLLKTNIGRWGVELF